MVTFPGKFIMSQYQTVFLTLVVVVVSTIWVLFRLKWKKRVRVLRARIGVFIDQGEEFYREAVGHPLYRRVLSSSTTINGVETRHYNYTLVKASQTESALSGRPLPISVRELPPVGFFVVTDVEAVEGGDPPPQHATAVGFRYQNGYAVVPRHSWNGGENIAIRANNGREWKIPRDVETKMYPYTANYSATAADLVFFKVPPGVWAYLGVKEVARKSFTKLNTGPFTVTGCTEEGGCLKSEGYLLGNETEDIHDRGLVSHMAYTNPGFSGALCEAVVEGTKKYRGIHIAGRQDGLNHNYAISAQAFLTVTKELGVDPTISVEECMQPESNESKAQQREWSFEKLEDRANVEMQTHLTNAEMEGLAGDQRFGPGAGHAALGEKRYRMQSQGERKKELSRDAAFYGNRPMPRGGDLANRVGRAAQATFQSNMKKKGKALWANIVEESIKVEKLPVYVSSCAERLYKRTVEDPLPDLPPETVQEDATDEQVTDLMTRLLGGDTSAIADAKGYTYESVFATPAMFHMREYISHAPFERVDIPEVMQDKSGQPFFSRYGKYKYYPKKSDKKAKDVKRGIPASLGLDYAKNAGCKTDYFQAPRTTDAIKSTLRQQAATIGKPPEISPFEIEGAWDVWKEMLEEYPAADNNLLSEGVGGFEKVLNTFEHKSSGWTARSKNLDKKSLAEKHKPWLLNVACARIILRATCSHSLPTMHPAEMVVKGLRDPAQAEIKDEPYPAEKADKSFWRVIWVASCLDTVVQGVLHHSQNKADIAGYQDGKFHWSLAGLGHDDAGIQRLGGALEEMMGSDRTLFSEDASRYDLTQSREMILLDGERRVYLDMQSAKEYGRPSSPGLHDAIMQESFCNSAHMLAFHGELWLVHHLGLTQSGVKSTTAQNCFSRTFAVKVAKGGNGGSLGDDNVSRERPDSAIMQSLGVIQKPGGVTASFEEGIPITSHLLKKKPDGVFYAEFQNLDKMIARLLMKYTGVVDPDTGQVVVAKPIDAQILGSCLFVTRESVAQQTIIRELAEAMNWPIEEAELYKDAPGDLCDD